MDRVGQQLGNYRLIRLLGQGGFAEVYLGEHIHLGTQAAIKVLQGRMSAQDLQDFTKEARTIASLKHPSILRVLDFGIEGATPFLVMDYASKGTLRDRHPVGTPLPITTILSYVKQMAAALQYAHDQKLVHRDIKPENMLVDANNTLLLSDFGIAIAAHKTQSLSTQDAVGTVVYMAPEQIKGKAQPASDQYSLAVVVYAWLCGALPFDGSTSIEIAMSHLTDPPPPLRSKVPTISQAVEQIVLRALSKNPQQRFPTITAFSDALEQASQSPRFAPPPPFQPHVVGSPAPFSLISPSASPIGQPSPQIRLARVPQRRGRRTISIVLFVLLIFLSVMTPIMIHLAAASPVGTISHSTGAAPAVTPTQLLVPTPPPFSRATPTASDLPETWIGPFNQPGYAQMHVELDVMSLNDGSFTGIWMGGFHGSSTYDIGQVSVAGQVVLFRSIPGQVQTDLQNSYGSAITMDAKTKVVQWRGQGNTSGTIWPSGYYYVVRNGNQLDGVAYESQGSELCTFSLQGTGSLGN